MKKRDACIIHYLRAGDGEDELALRYVRSELLHPVLHLLERLLVHDIDAHHRHRSVAVVQGRHRSEPLLSRRIPDLHLADRSVGSPIIGETGRPICRPRRYERGGSIYMQAREAEAIINTRT